MLELERLQVRIVSGRLGRGGGGNSSDGDDDADDKRENEWSNNGNDNIGKGTNVEDSPDPVIPPHRPLVGGGSAAAYEAARADHYRNVAELNAKKKNKGAEGSSSKDNPNDITNPMPGP